MPITLNQLIACGVQPTQARVFLDPLNDMFDRFEINTKNRMAAAIAESRVESTEFTHLEENLFYTTPDRCYQIFHRQFASINDTVPYLRNPQKLANRVYANRNGNGPEASGDGWKYRGRGIVQLTGKANYTVATQRIGNDYVNNPDLVTQPEHACLTFGDYWVRNNCNPMADAGSIDGITRAINGPAMVDASKRKLYYMQCLSIL